MVRVLDHDLPALRADRRGYVLDGSHDGFADRPDLSTPARRRLARWARRFTPDSVGPEQVALLDASEPRATGGVTDTLAALLHDAEEDMPESVARGFYEDLTPEQLRWMREPSLHPMLAGHEYPLTIGEMETLTGATARQLRHWERMGLLPVHRIDGHRRYLGAAVARAFTLKASKQHEIAALGTLADGGIEAARMARLMGAQVGSLAARVDGDAGRELTTAAATVVRLSRMLAEDAEPARTTAPPPRPRSARRKRAG